MTAESDDDARKHARIGHAIEELGLDVIRIHVIVQIYPLCGFSHEPPMRWPNGEIWIRRSQYKETAAACRDPEHELHSMQRFTMCEECERVVATLPPLPPGPVPPISDEEMGDREMVFDELGACGCDDAPPLPDPPIVPTEGRTCERCGVALKPDHPAVYCTNECALADSGHAPQFAIDESGEAGIAIGSLPTHVRIPGLGLGFESLTFDELAARLRVFAGDDAQLHDRLHRALIDAQLDGEVPEFYALCFHAIVLAVDRPEDAHGCLVMAAGEATSEEELAIVGAIRAIFERLSPDRPS